MKLFSEFLLSMLEVVEMLTEEEMVVVVVVVEEAAAEEEVVVETTTIEMIGDIKISMMEAEIQLETSEEKYYGVFKLT